ncbi:MAG: DbpA RNA binding domain-containing protein [Verrucomicrobia bacterium]|nr:DbpA RNA binding domain-containing protein [Verrucomicrobiota bacterium]
MDAVFGKLRETLQKGDYPACDEWIDRLLEQGFPATEMVAALIHIVRGETKPSDVASVEPDSSSSMGWPRLFINIGKNDNLRPADLKGAILNECGVQAEQIGKITLYANHSLVEIEEGVLDQVIATLKRTRIRQRKPSVRRDREEAPAQEGRGRKGGGFAGGKPKKFSRGRK